MSGVRLLHFFFCVCVYFCILLRNQSMLQSLQVNIVISYKYYVTNYNIKRLMKFHSTPPIIYYVFKMYWPAKTVQSMTVV